MTCSLTPATDLEGDERNEGKREEGWKKEGNGSGRRCLRTLATTAELFSHFGAINSHRIHCLCSQTKSMNMPFNLQFKQNLLSLKISENISVYPPADYAD